MTHMYHIKDYDETFKKMGIMLCFKNIFKKIVVKFSGTGNQLVFYIYIIFFCFNKYK